MGVNSSSSATGTITDTAVARRLHVADIGDDQRFGLQLAQSRHHFARSGQVTPAGANRNAGNAASNIAMGPCSRSALEKRSATT